MTASVTPIPALPAGGPPLPTARGPLSAAVLAALHPGPTTTSRADSGPRSAPEGGEDRNPRATWAADLAGADPYSDDVQLSLYCLYELHYRGFGGVEDDREWDPALLAVRRELEAVFLAALRAGTDESADVTAEIDTMLGEPVDAWGVSHHLRRDGEAWQLREYVALRSLYHLKEGDPQAFVIARLDGAAKVGLVTVEHDEYGAGDPERMHAHLFATMMRELDLDTAYGAYLDVAPADALAEVNLMSLCGLHRRLRGALVGQFATVELTSSPGADRLLKAMRRMGCSPAATAFYDEHVEADAVHEQVVRRDVLAPLLAAEPALAADVVFGMRASTLLADRLDAHLMRSWTAGRTGLRRPLPRAAVNR